MPYILDQWGQPILISEQRAFIGDDDVAPVQIDHNLIAAMERRHLASYEQSGIDADRIRSEPPSFDWNAHKAQNAARQKAEREAERAELEQAKAAGYAEGKASGLAEGRKIGRKAFYQRMNDIVRGAHGNGALAQAALDLALDAPDLSAAVALSIAGRGARGSASLANRDSLPDSLAIAKSQLAGA
ncbi:hypothetical protein X773_01160 [Mesorhizobium sp. LSJC285A00]|uniref:hypothetical protein n=1 Tax=Mesorhizobium sp. LSJC285A00 TaxID=1287338 RepID=UPI0003CEE64E|nr:hypothetical protein [Mesorhizobium sp. LSJC285A00]ESW91715.1 hypothetical protein X773_01160 [Mesorhizobium sp. LSJC285A00]